jgi:hypothetical protein
VGIFRPSISRIRALVEFEPPSVETRKGWGTRLIKLYGEDQQTEARYSRAECIGCREQAIMGRPDPKRISTSHVERQNLTMRMSMRRFTRLTNAFSKKIDSRFWAIALQYMHYNICRTHKSLRVTPAMEAGIAGHV